MWCRGLVAGILLAGTLGACAVVDPVDPRYDTVNRSLAKARNESILLNIIRSSHDWPMSFTTVPQVNPSMANVTTLGLPSFLLGPNPKGTVTPASPARDVLFGNTNNLTNSTTVSSNFSVSSLENGSFYSGLLSPVSLHDLNYFIRQGYSRELLFWLFADAIEVEINHHVIGYQFDPPYDYGCPMEDTKQRCFREFVEIAVITGLTVEATTVTPGAGGKGGGAAKGGGKGGDKGGGKGGDSSGGDSGGGGKGKTEYSRFCFDPVLADRGMKAMNPARLRLVDANYVDHGYKRSPVCGSDWHPGKEEAEQADTLQFQVGPLTFKIVTRSTYSIYQFLGKLLKQSREMREPAAGARIDADEGADGRAQLLPNLPRADEAVPVLSTVREDRNLLRIVTQPSDECFVETHFIDGLYCVPEEGSANTKRIFALLSQLIALKTSAADLAITPAVRVVQ
jgi:uncharacterized membrane protein YgcG